MKSLNSILRMAAVILVSGAMAPAIAQTTPPPGKSLAVIGGHPRVSVKKPDARAAGERRNGVLQLVEAARPATIRGARRCGATGQRQPSRSSLLPTGARAKGAVRGAAAGAVIGEVADNDAGGGAAVGATVGVLAGGRQARKAKAAAGAAGRGAGTGQRGPGEGRAAAAGRQVQERNVGLSRIPGLRRQVIVTSARSRKSRSRCARARPPGAGAGFAPHRSFQAGPPNRCRMPRDRGLAAARPRARIPPAPACIENADASPRAREATHRRTGRLPYARPRRDAVRAATFESSASRIMALSGA